MRNHPIVNGKATTFPKLAKRLGCGKDGARRRYNQLESLGPVTLHDLGALDRERKRRAARDARIVHERQNMRRELASIAARMRHPISVQRVQQIAGRLA
ncbi:MAG TPA: hypothetical protein VGE09_03165 [Pseudoxanthomonas sp.]